MRLAAAAEIAERLARRPDARQGGGMTGSEIDALETELGERLPPGFRELLARFGWIASPNGSMLGGGAGVPADLDLREVRRAHGAEASGLVPVARDADGRLFWMDPAHVGPYEPPLVMPGRHAAAPEHVAHDLASWLVRRLDETTGPAATDPGVP